MLAALQPGRRVRAVVALFEPAQRDQLVANPLQDSLAQRVIVLLALPHKASSRIRNLAEDKVCRTPTLTSYIRVTKIAEVSLGGRHELIARAGMAHTFTVPVVAFVRKGPHKLV
jgi:hypothetical protein